MTNAKQTRAISKTLSANDVGETGGHQAGILIPRRSEILSFFPPLGKAEKNPRHHLIFLDDNDRRWKFAYIYYNNAIFGGTRNEYRLTHMTAFIRQNNLRAGDEIILSRKDLETRRVSFQRRNAKSRSGSGSLKLGSSWKVIDL
jgi:hypothetical protein